MDEWRVIPEFPAYWVSEDGQVLKTTQTKGNHLMTPVWKAEHRCWGVQITQNYKPKFLPLHRLVWRVFRGKPVPRAICHIDGNKANNSLRNLAVGQTGRKRALSPEQIATIAQNMHLPAQILAGKLATDERVVNRYKRLIRAGKA